MNKTNIGWCTHTWNPVTGCKRGCTYCYARALHEKRRTALLNGAKLPEYYRKPFTEIQYHMDRLVDKDLKSKKPRTVFVGSMSDIAYWHPDCTCAILSICKEHPQHTFMFLSKSPEAYDGFDWPENTMQGLTLTSVRTAETTYALVKMLECRRPYLSIEPLMGPVYPRPYYAHMELVIVGAMTGSGAIKPESRWIESIKESVPADKIYWKENIKPYLGSR